MFSIFSKTPKPNNKPFEDLSRLLWEDNNDIIYRRDLLNPEKLDFSMDSLNHIDEYLEVIHQEKLENDEEVIKIALRIGSYVGEVVRKNTDDSYNWLEYKQAVKVNKQLKQFGMQLETMAVLWSEPDTVIMPFAKVVKYLQNGSEDSVYTFGKVFVETVQK
jgi:hypothetical protein